MSRTGSLGIAWTTDYSTTPRETIQLIVREDPDAVAPPRPTRALPPGPPPPPAEPLPVEPSISGQAARRGAVRVTVTCVADCRVGGEVHIRGRRVGRLAAGAAEAGTPTTLTLSPASERVARLVRRARRDDRRVVVRVTVRTPGAAPMARRIVLR